MKKRADGRYLKQITDKRTGKKINFYGKSAREVNQKILEYTAGIEEGITFTRLADLWWAKHADHLAVQTVDSYKRGYLRAKAYFKNKRAREIVPKDIVRYLDGIAGQGYAFKTVSNYRLVVNLILDYGVVENYISVNPCTAVKVPKGLARKKRTSASTDDEEIIKRSGHIWIYPSIALYTGMRKGEILALQWRDIDFEHSTISVTKSVAFDNNTPFIKTPKTEAGKRTVPLLAPLRDLLLQQPDRLPEHYVISLTGDQPLSLHQYGDLWNDYKSKTGISCTSHQLRHSFASIGFEAGVPIKSMQGLLGHRQYSTTMDTYTDLRQKAIDNATKMLETALGQSKNSQNSL